MQYIDIPHLIHLVYLLESINSIIKIHATDCRMENAFNIFKRAPDVQYFPIFIAQHLHAVLCTRILPDKIIKKKRTCYIVVDGVYYAAYHT